MTAPPVGVESGLAEEGVASVMFVCEGARADVRLWRQRRLCQICNVNTFCEAILLLLYSCMLTCFSPKSTKKRE